MALFHSWGRCSLKMNQRAQRHPVSSFHPPPHELHNQWVNTLPLSDFPQHSRAKTTARHLLTPALESLTIVPHLLALSLQQWLQMPQKQERLLHPFPEFPMDTLRGWLFRLLKKKKKRISKLQKHSQWDLYSIGSFRLQEQGRPIVLPSLMGVYCEDKQDADLAAAHTAGPHRELLVARHCPGWTWSSWPAMQLLSWLNSIPSLCLGSFTFKREMIIIPISLACWED